jgi:hypothetical protein
MASKIWFGTNGFRCLLSWILVSASWSSGIGQESVPAQEGETKTQPPTEAKTKAPAFLRIDKSVSGEPRALQTAVARYRIVSGTHKGAVVELIGAVHVGEKAYYSDLNDRFKEYDAVLYELVARPEDRPRRNEKRASGNPVSSIQTGMKDSLKLAFQLDEIDYQASNFVHADMSPEEFGEDMARRNDGVLSMFARVMGAGFATQNTRRNSETQAEMMSALFSRDTMKLRRAMAMQFETMDSQMASLADKNGKSTLLTERNGKAFEVLQQQLNAGKRKLAVFYGAGHLIDMHERLLRDFQAQPIGLDWVDAWDLSVGAAK